MPLKARSSVLRALVWIVGMVMLSIAAVQAAQFISFAFGLGE